MTFATSTTTTGARRDVSAEDVLSRSVVTFAAAAWVVFLAISWAVQPAPADPDTPLSVSAALVGIAFHGALLAAAVGLGMRRRFGLIAGIGGGLALVGAAVVCWAGGHTGAWIAVQFTSGVGLTLASLGLLRLS